VDDLLQAQSSLARALGRARAGEDRELSARVRELGETLVHLLGGLLKLTRVHSPENKAFDQPVEEFVKALAGLNELLGQVALVTVEDQIYLNDVRIRWEGKGQADLGNELRRHNTGGLTFHAPLAGPQVRALVAALAGPAAPARPRGSLGERLRQADVTTVELQGIYRFRTVGADEAQQLSAAAVLERMLELAASSLEGVQEGRVLNPLVLRRSVVDALAVGIEAPAFWLAFPDCPPHAAHATEVAVLSLLIGRAGGLPAGFQQDLGIAALVHDAGYVAPGIGEGAAALARHPIEGVRVVLRQRGFSEAKVRRLRAVLEHHRDQADPAGAPSLMGSILRIAEDYANVGRLYGAKVLRADALGAMVKASGAAYHPVLVQLLVNALGRHPPGTLVELEGGALGRVTAPARSPETWDRPLVRLLDRRTHQPTGELVDLAQGGTLRRALPG